MSLASMLNRTCTITREVLTQDSVTGEIVRTFSNTVAAGAACAVQVLSAERAGTQPEAGETYYDVYFAYGQDVGVGDRLTAIAGLTNFSLEVRSDPSDDAGRGTYSRVRCLHKTGGAT